MELSCAECVPDNMPLVTSHRAANGSLRAEPGDEVTLACGGGKFLAYPLLDTLVAVCEAGRYRVRRDRALRHLLDLGCQESIFEDVLHQVRANRFKLITFHIFGRNFVDISKISKLNFEEIVLVGG